MTHPPRRPRRQRLRPKHPCEEPVFVTGDATLPIVCRTDDPAEAVERIVPRRNLLVESGDIFISRAAATIRSSHHREVYHLSRHGMGPVPGRFTSFENAVGAGDSLATQYEVRLYFIDSPGEPPQLLKDCRRSPHSD